MFYNKKIFKSHTVPMSPYLSTSNVPLMNLFFCEGDDDASFCDAFFSFDDTPNPQYFHPSLPQELDLSPAIDSTSSLNDKAHPPSEKAPSRNQFRQ